MRVFWQDAEKTILIRELANEWTWDDYQLSVLQMRQLIHEVSHDVFVIIDGRDVKIIPKDAIHHFQSANRKIPPHVKMRFLVSSNKLVYELFSIVRRLSGEDFQDFIFVSSMDEAYQKIAEESKPMSS